MGIRVLLDLVPGHTSEEHPWFLRSCEEEENELYDRCIWTDNAFTRGDTMPFIGGEAPRNGTYIINYFKSQPALNYGYTQINEPLWQQPITAPGPMQWKPGKNLGFSTADEGKLYLPVDPAENAPTVQAQDADRDPLLNHMRRVIALRHSEPDLQSYRPFTVYSAQKSSRLFAYRRGRILLTLNPGLSMETMELDGKYDAFFTVGAPTVSGSAATLPAQSFLILKPCE